MFDFLLALIAVGAIAAVGMTGLRFVRHDDEEFGDLAIEESPALWTPAMADAVSLR